MRDELLRRADFLFLSSGHGVTSDVNLISTVPESEYNTIFQRLIIKIHQSFSFGGGTTNQTRNLYWWFLPFHQPQPTSDDNSWDNDTSSWLWQTQQFVNHPCARWSFPITALRVTLTSILFLLGFRPPIFPYSPYLAVRTFLLRNSAFRHFCFPVFEHQAPSSRSSPAWSVLCLPPLRRYFCRAFSAPHLGILRVLPWWAMRRVNIVIVVGWFQKRGLSIRQRFCWTAEYTLHR